MKWTHDQLGVMPPLTWYEWGLMACVFIILIFAGWALIKLSGFLFEVMKGKVK